MRIVLASVLKPVNDPRLLARLGRTLAGLPQAQVHVVAHRSAEVETERDDTTAHNVRLHPIFSFPRLSLGRLLASFTLLRRLARLQPDILVVGAAELLPAALWWRWRTGGQLVYDVRENYALNLRTQQVFPSLIARGLAWLVEQAEAMAAPRLAGVLLAERTYTRELPWLARSPRVAVIENKYQPPSPAGPRAGSRIPETGPLRLVVTGTLSELYGTFHAVALADELVRRLGPAALELKLVGYCPRRSHYEKLKQLAASRPWLVVAGGDRQVAHGRIVEAIRQAHVGLLPYRPHPSLDACIPTKLWEYLGEALPVAVPGNPLWAGIVKNYGAGIVVDYDDVSAAATVLLQQRGSTVFYPAGPPREARWETEAGRLRSFFGQLAMEKCRP